MTLLVSAMITMGIVGNPTTGVAMPSGTEDGILFRYADQEAREVFLAGDFNRWNPKADRMMRRNDGFWELPLKLAPGKWQYKFVADGNWHEDPGNPEVVDDGFGGWNSVLRVLPDGRVGHPIAVEKVKPGPTVEQKRMTRQRFSSRRYGSTYEYSEYLPTSYDGAKAFPLIIALNGYADHSPGLLRLAEGRGYLAVMPGAGFEQEVRTLNRLDLALELVEHLRQVRAVESRRIYLTGMSNGGHDAAEIGFHYPGVFAAIAPIFGYFGKSPISPGDDEKAWKESDLIKRWAPQARELPIYIAHGARDAIVPVNESRNLYQELKSLGFDVVYTEYPDEGHTWGMVDQDLIKVIDFFDARRTRK